MNPSQFWLGLTEYISSLQELLDDGLCQEMNHTLGLHRLEGHAMDVLYYLAKQGHTEEVFKAIPQATMSGIIEHVGKHIGYCTITIL